MFAEFFSSVYGTNSSEANAGVVTDCLRLVEKHADCMETVLLPILDYADTCYSDITEEQLNKLERLQNFCMRFIFGLRKYYHISEYLTKLNVVSGSKMADEIDIEEHDVMDSPALRVTFPDLSVAKSDHRLRHT
ncbi:unnamed protein product [Plutella xylostella]|uniref:(diamondback moth) hypothetical protein n=1 Tax=Plutella xylostella TaxID=51655 RepID=A0A8S4GFH5_PLUXY|nr:unnamed protein product [Plutella xylostella]